MLKIRKYTQYSRPVKITGYTLAIIGSLLIPIFAPIFLWVIYQCELNRYRHNIGVKLNNWAVNNIDDARRCEIEPNFRLAVNVPGIAGLYLDLTSYNSDGLLEEFFRKSDKYSVVKSEKLTNADIYSMKAELKRLEKGDAIGCLGAVILGIIIFKNLSAILKII